MDLFWKYCNYITVQLPKRTRIMVLVQFRSISWRLQVSWISFPTGLNRKFAVTVSLATTHDFHSGSVSKITNFLVSFTSAWLGLSHHKFDFSLNNLNICASVKFFFLPIISVGRKQLLMQCVSIGYSKFTFFWLRTVNSCQIKYFIFHSCINSFVCESYFRTETVKKKVCGTTMIPFFRH